MKFLLYFSTKERFSHFYHVDLFRPFQNVISFVFIKSSTINQTMRVFTPYCHLSIKSDNVCIHDECKYHLYEIILIHVIDTLTIRFYDES